VFVSPLHSKVVGGGRALDLATRLSTLDAEKFTVVAGTDELQRTLPLQEALAAASAIAAQFMSSVRGAPSPAGDSDVARDRACVQLDEAVTQLLLRVDAVDCTTEDIRACRKAVVACLTALHDAIDSYVTKKSEQKTSTPVAPAPAKKLPAAVLPLPLLPAGVYTLIASCWTKATPGAYELNVQTETPHELHELPVEGASFESSVIQGQLRNVAFTASGIPVSVPLASSLFSEHAHATITFGRAGDSAGAPVLFVARALTVEPDPKADKSSVPLLLALYKCDEDVGTASLSTTSGCLSVTGSAIPTIAVDATKRYQLVLLAGAPSTTKFVLRLFCSVKFNALLS
jgi:hypothetical protein